jgi:AhpD family alkylhydroperoxidase
MTLVDLIDEQSAPLLVRHLFTDGDPGPIAAALAQVPELCQVALPFIGAALGPSHVPLRWKEIAILRTSVLLGCRYCIEAHTVVALDAGLTSDEVAALRGGREGGAGLTDPTEAAVLAWVDEVAAGKGPVPDAIGRALRDRVDDHTVVELTVTVGTTMLLNRLATALGLPSSPAVLQRLAAEGFAR